MKYDLLQYKHLYKIFCENSLYIIFVILKNFICQKNAPYLNVRKLRDIIFYNFLFIMLFNLNTTVIKPFYY